MTTHRHNNLRGDKPAKCARGFSLVELMVAITLGLIVIAAVAQIFVSTRSTYALEEGLARTQENGRFAMEFLTQDIRMAGYAGCVGNLQQGTVTGSGPDIGCTASLCNIAEPPTVASNFTPEGIVAHTYVGPGTDLSAWEPDLPSEYFAAGAVKADTDVITVQYASPLGTHLTGNTAPTNANIQILANSGLANDVEAGDVLVLSDCKSAVVFKTNGVSSGTFSGSITITHPNTVNSDSFLPHRYDDRAEMMKMVSRVYYIGNGTGGEPALMRRNLETGGLMDNPVELVQGIEDMRLVYGQDTDGDRVANIYLKADAVTDWSQVVSVRLGILARTTSNVESTGSPESFELAGIPITAANDKRRRQQYNATIQLRN